MTSLIVILLVCLLFEAFFSGSEIAFVSANRVKLRAAARRKGTRAGRLRRFLKRPQDLISTALVGTNICVVVSTVVTTHTLLPHFPDAPEVISMFIVTPLVLVFGEILPKTIFQHYADDLAPRLVGVMLAIRWIFLPLVLIGRGVSEGLLRLLRVQARPSMTRKELRLLISLPSAAGADQITADEQRMIDRIFDFAAVSVETVMLHLSEVVAVKKSASIADAARVVAETTHSRLPVFRERVHQIVGIVHSFDLLRATSDGSLEQLMRAPIYVPPNSRAVDVLVQMQNNGQGMAVVVDEYGGAVGVVTAEDIVELVVGEIADEHDTTTGETIRLRADGSYTLSGRTLVKKLNTQLKLDLARTDDYETVAGLILDQLRYIPEAGETIKLDGVWLTVTRVNARAIEEVRLVLVGGEVS